MAALLSVETRLDTLIPDTLPIGFQSVSFSVLYDVRSALSCNTFNGSKIMSPSLLPFVRK